MTIAFTSLVSAPVAPAPLTALAKANRAAERALLAGDLPAYMAACEARDALTTAEPAAIVFTSVR